MKTELKKAELTQEEIQFLLDHYDQIADDLSKVMKGLTGKPAEQFVADKLAEIQVRRAEIARYSDGRWTNRGPGRKRKAQAETPALPLNINPTPGRQTEEVAGMTSA